MEEIIKIKPLTKSQILISLDRLTRFKATEEKYLRVFKDIIISNLLNPTFKRKQLDEMDYEVLTKFAEDIFNFSLKFLNNPIRCAELDSASQSCSSSALKINKKLLKYEKSVFKIDKNVGKLLENKIDYEAALSLIDGGLGNPPYTVDGLALNLKWLKSLSSEGNQRQNRTDSGLKFPIEKVVIVEGITEEILLPKFAQILGYDFDKAGINLISAGGKNQVVKLVYKFAEILKLPIFVLLDNDAKDNFEEIAPKLRAHDKVYVLKSGEFEDILPLNLIKRTLNKHPRIYSPVLMDELKSDLRMTEVLNEVFKQRGLEFKKAEFASLVAENILTIKDVSREIEAIISELK